MNSPDSSTSNRVGRFKNLLNKNRDMVLVFLSAQLNDLFGNADEALLDFAEHAENNAIQSRFFEAMGAIRKNRTGIERQFLGEIKSGFGRFFQPPSDKVWEIAPEEMALVNLEQMDESVAVENLITQSRYNYFMQLHDLGQRLAVLNHGRKVQEKDIPSGPTHLVNSFRVSTQTLNIDAKAKIVLYALFDKFVMRHLGSLYDEFNGNLKNNGILPNLKPDFLNREHSERRAPGSDEQRKEKQSAATAERSDTEQTSGEDAHDAGYQAQASLGEELFDSILQLMDARRHSAASGPSSTRTERVEAVTNEAHGGTAGSQGVGDGTSSDAGTVAPREHLMSTIDSIRPVGVGHGRSVLSDLDALPKVAADQNFLDQLKGLIASERGDIYSQIPPAQMQGIDADTIDLVGMLFEYMLDDPLLPNLAKALFSHLHTPYLKLSLVDSTLMVDSEHPARLLLDLMVEAGGEWVYENDITRGIFPQMRVVVDRVLKESTNNDELFPELLEYLMAETDEYRRKTDAVEHRARESVTGREKLQVAKQRAAREIHDRKEQVRLPRSAQQFLARAWTDRLVFILLREEEGELSEEWNRALQTVDELIWLFGPEGAEASEKEIHHVGSALQEKIGKALDSLGGYHQNYMNKLFEMLSNPAAVARWHEKWLVAPNSEHLMADSESLIHSTMSSLDRGEEAWEESEFEPFGQPSLFGDETRRAHETSLSGPELQMLEKLQQLQFGTWFEIRDKDNETRRLKLSWLSPLTATCMFVEKNGAKAQIKTLADTARMMVSGEAKVIPKPKQQFVERALQAIKHTLQRSLQPAD